ncbi:MAG: type IX secretion system protein PorQ [Bacteroidales bacterium]|nr:type IX secretion system protein PorQ [Bacteroidales bacterium]
MKRILIILVSLLSSLPSWAQEGSFSQTVLRLPTSSHVAALGGENISLTENTPWAGMSNPALLSGVSNLSLGLNFMTYAGGSTYAGAEFVKAFGERHTGAAFAQMLSYGEMSETDASGHELGSFSPKDIVFGVGYSYLLSDRWAGGANLKGIYSKYADFSAFALAVDLGINYLDEENDLSISATMMNIGAPLKTFDDRTERLPYNLQVGFSKGMAHLPVRFSVTLTDLTRWRTKDYFHPADEKLSFGKKALNHFVVGLDVEPTDYLYLGVGYNFRRAYELKAAGSSHWAGITAGAGLRLSRFKLGLSYAKYHLSCSSLMCNAGYSF